MNRTYLLGIVAALLVAPLAYAHSDGGIYGTPKTYCEDKFGDQEYHDYLWSYPPLGSPVEGSIESDCPYSAGTENPTFDGHYEWATGGAWLVASDGDGITWGATACGWPYPDHPEFPTVWVFDHVLSQIPADVIFSVFADTRDNIPPLNPNAPNCGDLEGDFGTDCVNYCTVGFRPGLDGTYQVYVHNGVAGHVWTNSL